MMHFKSYNQPPKGVTLIETLIFTTIGSMILFALSASFVSGMGTRAQIDAQERLTTVSQTNQLLILSQLEGASDITTPASGSSNQLIFTDVDGNTIDYNWTGEDITLSINTVPVETLATMNVRITQFNVTAINTDPDGIRVELTYEASVFNNRTMDFVTAFSFTAHYGN